MPTKKYECYFCEQGFEQDPGGYHIRETTMVDSSTGAEKRVTHKCGPVLEKDYEPQSFGG
jgi:hypothetical protein